MPELLDPVCHWLTRSDRTHPVRFADGTASAVAHSLKQGIAAVYWYYLQRDGERWEVVDLRVFVRGLDDAALVQRACRPDTLAYVAELLSQEPPAGSKVPEEPILIF